MKIGKVSESVLKRSVLKEIKTNRDEILNGAVLGGDCAILTLQDGEELVISTDPICGTRKDIGTFALHKTVNNIATKGGTPIAILVSMMLPERVRESHIKEMMQHMNAFCVEQKLQIIGGHTEVSEAVNQPVITITGVGKRERNQKPTTKVSAGQDIVISKWIALEGTARLAKEYEEELKTKLPMHLIREAQSYEDMLSIIPEAATAIRSDVSLMHDISSGGIFGALWETAVATGVGLEVDLKKIPIRQETIEVCEYFGLNPYSLMSGGSLLMICDKGHELVKQLNEAGIHASVIGKITDNNDKVIRNEDEVRFLEPPKSDEWYQVKTKV